MLTWTSSHAESLDLFALADGEPLAELVLSVPESERASGSVGVAPKSQTRYSLVARSGSGTEKWAEALVDVAPTAILAFDATPTEAVAGEEVTLQWSTRTTGSVTLDFIDTFIREETQEPFVDVGALGGTHLPLGTACSSSILVYGCELLTFPSGFAFPFGGADRAAARIYSNGVISFATGTASGSNSLNDDFPSTGTYSFAHIAPFWDGLAWNEDRYPNGNIWYLHREDPVAGDSLVVQWKGISLTGDRETSDLNFEVVLWENGDFEYRYGAMSPGTALPELATGSSATIGYQLPDHSSFDNINYNKTIRIRDRLEHRSFAYRVPPSTLPTSGSIAWRPYTTRDSVDVVITATGGTGTVTETLTLDIRRKPILDVVQAPPAQVEAGEIFRIAWETQYATAVTVEDGAGVPLCTASEHAIGSGFCDLSGATEGLHTYVVRATGARGSNSTQSIEVAIFEPFGIAVFEADPITVDLGQSATLSWETFGAVTVSLTADGTELLPPGHGGGVGSLDVPGLTADTTFVLTVTNTLGLTREEAIDVEIWKVSLDVAAIPPDVRPGTPVQIDVTASALDGGATPVVYGTFPMAEVTSPGSEFQDIRMLPGVGILTMSNADNGFNNLALPSNFVFPFFGKDMGALRVFVDGYVSFATPSNVYQNVALPSAASDAIKGVHLAPFWDDLNLRTNGQVHAGLIDPDTYVVQWTDVSLFAGSNVNDQSKLSFQLVLGRDGSFEYRYGTMLTQGNPSSSCYPDTCANEVAGSSATIGYQHPGAGSGFTLHFGGTTNAAANVPFPGGVAGRTFRYEPIVGTDSFTITPSGTQTLLFCTKSGASTVCKELEVRAEFGIRSFTSTSESLAFGQSATLQWATEGGTQLVLRENGVIAQTITDPQTIDAGTLHVSPSMRTTYALELTAPGRSGRETVDIDVERFSISASGPTGISLPGEPVTLTWDLTNDDPTLTPVVFAPMAEVEDRPFASIDLEYDPDAIELHGADVASGIAVLDFDPDFTFDYLGSLKSRVRVATEGYLTFDNAATSSTGSNQLLPNTTAAYKRVHLAAFWDDLHTRTTGRVLAKRLDADSYAIQWSHVSLEQGSSATEEFDLNFVIVLHRDGSFEYRFGDMLAPAAGSTTCAPASCVSEVNGSSATIGYQDETGTLGHLFHFGGNGRVAGQPTVVPGLANRTWVFDAHSTSGSVEVAPTETTEYRICVREPDTGKVTCAEPVEVRVDWGILAFEVTPDAVAPGNDVTISWTVAGIDSLVLEANGTTIASHGPGSIPASGTIVDLPQGATAYTLTVESLGRVRSETRLVNERAFDLDVQIPAGRYFPGEPVELTWNGQPLQSGSFSLTAPMGEVDATAGQPAAYQDVSQFADATEVTISAPNGYAVIPLPFDFPYFGTDMTELQLYVDGYLTFSIDPSKTGVSANTELPNSGANQSRIHLAPFWDDHFMRGHDSVWTWQPEPDQLVIQWKNFNRSAGSAAPQALYDLNFQVVLFADGSFEYRYGEMKAPPQPFAYASCYPNTCELEANGSSATIGYQNVGGTMGYSVHFGGSSAAEVVPFAGGLAGRSFRFDAAQAGSAQLVVGGSTRTHEICGELNGFVECKEVTIRPVAEPGDLVVSELMIAPAGGAGSQWFELRNVSDDAIDLDGFVLATNSGSHAIAGPLVVPARGFVTFAASAAGVGFVPDHVFGADLSLGGMVDRLVLRAGVSEIAAAEWGSTWFIPPNRTLALDPSHHLPGAKFSDDFGRWCEGSAQDTPGALSAGCRWSGMDVDPSSTAPFVDISSTGRRLVTLEADSGIDAVPVSGFSMPFFGETVSRVFASSNGWISFAPTLPTGGTSSPSTLPRTATAAPAGPLVAAFFDDLKCDRAVRRCTVHYEQKTIGGDEVLVVQWTNFTRGSYAGTLTVQAQLWSTGGVVIAFGDVHADAEVGSTAWKAYRGSTAWIGLEPSDRAAHVTAHLRTELPLAGRAFRFSPR